MAIKCILFLISFLYAYDVQTELFCKIDNRGKVTAMTAYKGNILYAQRNNIFLYDLKTHKKAFIKFYLNLPLLM